MKNVFVSLLLVLPGTEVFSADDWAYRFSKYACGQTEELGLRKANQLCAAEAARYEAKCQPPGGEFSWNCKRGFCTPYDPNSIGCPTKCPSFGYVYCRMPVLESLFESLDGLKPGEIRDSSIFIRNVSGKPIPNATAEVSVTNGQSVAKISNKFLAWDMIAPSMTAKSTTPFTLAISSDAECGKKFTLKLAVDSASGGRITEQDVQLGKFIGVPIVVSNEALNLEIGGDGATLDIPIQLVGFAQAKARKLHFSFKAKVDQQLYVRFTLVSPSGASVIVSQGYANSTFFYDKDVTEVFSESNALGKWKLIAKVWGQSGTLLSYALNVLPDAYKCE